MFAPGELNMGCFTSLLFFEFFRDFRGPESESVVNDV